MTTRIPRALFAAALGAALFQAPAALAAGDAARGKDIAAQWCAACHGRDGNSPSAAFPILAGQHEAYLMQAIMAYRNGDRADAVMAGTLRPLTRQQLEDAAAWFASQKGLGGGGGGGAAQAAGAAAAGTGVVINLPQANSPPQSPLEVEGCAAIVAASKGDKDSDRDGLADRYDAAPKDAAEFARDADGDGRFEICSIPQFQAIQVLGTVEGTKAGISPEQRLARNYELVQDLDAGGFEGWRPIGSCGPQNSCMIAGDKFGFGGFFDGNGHVVRNLVVKQPELSGVGLFGVVARTGSLGNIALANADVNGMGGVGIVVGVNFGKVFRCSAEGKASGNRGVAGIMGANAGGMFDCHARADVTGQDVVGGAVGDSIGPSWRSSAQGRVTGKNGVGGFAAVNSQGALITESFATGSVTGEKNVGGFVGFNTDATIANSYAVTSVTATSLNAGGLVGFNSQSAVRNSYATGRVVGVDAAAVLVGRNTKSTVLQSWAVGTAEAPANAGVLVGDNTEGTVIRSVGEEKAASLLAADGASTGWTGAEAAAKPELVYCDRDGSKAIEPAEQVPDNLIWDFGTAADLPALRCTTDGVARQRNQ